MTALRKLGDKYKEEEKEMEIAGRKVIVRVITFESGKQRSHCFFSDRNIQWLTKRNNELSKQIVDLEKGRLKK